MKEYCYGLLHGVDEVNRLIAIKTKHKIDYYYLARSMFADFMAYGFQFTEEPGTIKASVRNVLNIENIMEPYGQKPKLYYDISPIKSGTAIWHRNQNCFLTLKCRCRRTETIRTWYRDHPTVSC